MDPGLVERFREEGFAGPISILSPEGSRRCLSAIKRSIGRPLDWHKSYAVSSRAFFELAAHPAIVDVVAAILGDNVMLWGASIQDRLPGRAHPWHCDIESAPHTMSTVAVWIGMKNVSRSSSLFLLPYSHRFGLSIQEARSQSGVDRERVDQTMIESWARERDPRSHVVVPDVSEGQAIFFDGQLWHGSDNRSRKRRYALLLQYATPSTEIRIPSFGDLDWPFTYLDLPRPPCVMIRGSSNDVKNRFLSPPPAGRTETKPQLTTRACRIDLPIALDEDEHWIHNVVLRGSTSNLSTIECHVSALRNGCTSHPPHRHPEEEIIFLLSGEADMILPDLGSSQSEQRVRLTPGSLAYYPQRFGNAIEAVGDEPAQYMVAKFLAKRPEVKGSVLSYNLFDAISKEGFRSINDSFRIRTLFEGPTDCLRKLHVHASLVQPGGGYRPHVDAYDVLITVLDGEIEINGATYGRNSIIFFAGGEPHGMHNPGTEEAHYLVFEFHGSTDALPAAKSVSLRSRVRKMLSPTQWRRRLRRIAGRLR